MSRIEKLNQTLKIMGYQPITIENKVIVGYNRETIIVEVNDTDFLIKIGYNHTDVLRKQTLKRKQIKTVIDRIIDEFDEAEQLRDHYTELFIKNMAPFYEPKWLSESYYKRLVRN